jgi:glycine oxidase
MLQGTELANVEPEVHWQGDRATLFDEIAQVRNPRLMQALIADVRARGVEIRESVAATGFEVRNGQVAGIHTRSGLIETRRCIVAAGAWTGELMRGLDLYLPIQPVRGQMLLFKGEPVLLSHMVMQGSHYLIPRRDGRILGGSTLEFVGFDKTTTEVARKSLVDAAVAMVPVLAECEVEAQWAGLRPGSPEGIPYIGEHPKIHGLHVCSGHFRNGLVMAPASARLMADLVLGRAPILDPGPYGLDRP